ncbi:MULTISPECIES: hypothetical protein [Nocardiaceae]|uniref:Uncharacterized protein n=1 Tax=Rhodococcoides corynebacterioides TaxID=53972 RepID=A0ABS2KYK3_9NOCA|nr:MULTISPECIES: hypothetical protein [Rhodococcus]MBM7417012.1 hypothetical protein [Rhodococcus corynebacterioides]MBP1115265.1 hypothetical protein [Rhodococcus sp. PvP016]
MPLCVDQAFPPLLNTASTTIRVVACRCFTGMGDIHERGSMPGHLLSGPVAVVASESAASADPIDGACDVTDEIIRDPDIGTVMGLWARKGLWVGGEPEGGDEDVRWLQGPSRFVDLRRPVQRPDFEGVECWNDLQPEHRRWIATQDGFAGTLQRTGNHFRWNRYVELHPSSRIDEGVMSGDASTLVETGLGADFTEHWQRTYSSPEHCGAIELHDGGVARAVLVRCGSLFGWAKSDPNAVHGLEIALGVVHEGNWIVEVSSLPYREGAHLAPVVRPGIVRLLDADACGTESAHHWNITYSEGNLDL